MRFVIDAMLPPATAPLLNAAGHDAITPVELGRHDLPDLDVIERARAQGRVIVTENIADFASVDTPVILVRKRWWPNDALDQRLADALKRFAAANPTPSPWPIWLSEEFR